MSQKATDADIVDALDMGRWNVQAVTLWMWTQISKTCQTNYSVVSEIVGGKNFTLRLGTGATGVNFEDVYVVGEIVCSVDPFALGATHWCG
jgi:hypothetical protein